MTQDFYEFSKEVLERVPHPDCMDAFEDELMWECFMKDMTPQETVEYIIDNHYTGK